MKRSIFGVLFLLLSLSLGAQNLIDSFDGIKSQGPIPADLRLSLDELYAQDRQRVRDYNNGKSKSNDKVLEASYRINRLMASGRVLYGDPITQMLNRIADTLLSGYPELRSQIRIYTIKSPDVNAFMTGQGMLFVTTGMVAQVEDEAQLAFVIGHEAIHYLRNHNWETITMQDEDRYGRERQERKLHNFVKYHHRSHAMENEADSLCLTMFYLGSPYDKHVTDGFFDVLQYGYLPFDIVTIDSNFFDTRYYHFPSQYFLSEVAPVTARDDYDDSKSTHPNLLKRRERCAALLASANGGYKFVTTTQDHFLQLRDLARLECIRQNLIYSEYTRAFYDIIVMQKYLPSNPFLTKAKAEAIYGLSKFREYSNNNDVVGDYKLIEGEAQQAYYFFRKVSKEELNLLAVRTLWEARSQYPTDTTLALMAEDAMKDLARRHNMTTRSFSPILDTASYQMDSTSKSKYEKIKQKRRNQNRVNMSRYFFTDLMEHDPSMKPYLDHCLSHANDSVPPQQSEHSNIFAYAAEYYVVKGNDLKCKKSNRMESRLTGYIAQAAKKEHLGMVDFSDQGLHRMTSEQQYNDFVALNEWTNEIWQSRGSFSRPLTQQPAMNDLVRRYDADRINLTQVMNWENKNPLGDRTAFLFFMPILYPITIPVFISDLCQGWEYTVVNSIYVDASTGNWLSGNTYRYDLADGKDVVKGSIYDNIQKSKGLDSRTFLNRHLLLTADGILGFNQGKEHTDFIGLSSDDNRHSLFQIRPRLGLEYIINKDYSIRATYSYAHTTSLQVDEEFAFGWYEKSRYNLDVTSWGLGFRKYQYPAPMGFFWGFDALLHRSQLDTEHNPFLSSPIAKTQINKIGINFEWGRNRIFFDRFIVRFGFNVGVIGSFPFNPNDMALTPKEHDQSWYNSLHAGQKLWIQNLYTLNLGIGFLPF